MATNNSTNFSAATGNFYKLVNASNVSYATAYSAAHSVGNKLNGVEGHLLTITSNYERTFVSGMGLTGFTWVAAQDLGTNNWYWTDGPENNVNFWNGTSTGAAVSARYAGWDASEPDTLNNAAIKNTTGYMADQGSVNNHYIIEWEGRSVMAGVTKDTVTLYGGKGADNLYGGDGADVFLFTAAGSTTNTDADNIYNFNAALDTLRIGNLLSGYTPGVSDPDLFVMFVPTGSDTVVYVDRDGAGGAYSFSRTAPSSPPSRASAASMSRTTPCAASST